MLRILHIALMASVLIYGVVLYVVTRQEPSQPPPSFDEFQAMIFGLAGTAGAMLLAMVFLRRKFMPPRKLPGARVAWDEPLSTAASGAMNRLNTASLVTWAMAEGVACFGLVIGMILKEAWPIYPFGGVALLAMLIYAPRRAVLEEVVRATME